MKKFDKYTEEQDGRVKLNTAQKEEIKRRYDAGGVSWNNLAREYKVSKRLIGFIVNPATKERVVERVKKNWKSYKATTEERKLIMRKFRAKKRSLGLATG